MLVVSQDERWADRVRKQMWEHGYYVVQTDLRDAFLSYREISFQVVLTETTFKDPDVHPEDLEDEEFPGKPLPLKDAIARMRSGKDHVIIVACGPEFANLSAQEFVAAAVGLGVDAVIEKPFEPEKLAEILDKLKALRKPKKPAAVADEDEDADEENPVG
jgi:CheY-like chemotaxis protein